MKGADVSSWKRKKYCDQFTFDRLFSSTSLVYSLRRHRHMAHNRTERSMEEVAEHKINHSGDRSFLKIRIFSTIYGRFRGAQANLPHPPRDRVKVLCFLDLTLSRGGCFDVFSSSHTRLKT